MLDLIINILLVLIGGLMPALLWLWFWLKEDKAHPEPNKLIIKTFIFGALMVPIAYILQKSLDFTLFDGNYISLMFSGGIISFIIILFMAAIEEFVKFAAAKNGGLDNKNNDEPIDVPIYMVTAALGFAALENILFLSIILSKGQFALAVDVAIIRSIGSTLLHVSSSAIIGVFGSFSYFYKNSIQKKYLFFGFMFAILLHTLFNLFIINNSNLEKVGYISVWMFTMLILILFERIKKIKVSKIKNV
jgi:protease PrsW